MGVCNAFLGRRSIDYNHLQAMTFIIWNQRTEASRKVFWGLWWVYPRRRRNNAADSFVAKPKHNIYTVTSRFWITRIKPFHLSLASFPNVFMCITFKLKRQFLTWWW
jgi:hypothetical protein